MTYRTGSTLSCLTALVIGAAAAQAGQMKAAAGPQPGDCKSTPSNWVGARSTSIVPLGGQSYQARGIPCFFYPVQ